MGAKVIGVREGVRKRRAGAEDVEIGRKIRAMRLERGLSQSGLAEGIGLTFQQVQKYEKGANRVSAERQANINWRRSLHHDPPRRTLARAGHSGAFRDTASHASLRAAAPSARSRVTGVQSKAEVKTGSNQNGGVPKTERPCIVIAARVFAMTRYTSQH